MAIPAIRNAALNTRLVMLGYFVLCQAGWFAIVLGTAHGAGWAGMLFAACLVGWHLAYAADWRRELRFVAATTAIGWSWESVLAHAGVLRYPAFSGVVAPYWMAGLWAMFAIQFNVLLVWLRSRPVLASLLGAVAAPLSFRAGALLGAVQFPNMPTAMAAIALGWALLMPLLLRLSQRWDGVHQSQRLTHR